MKFKTFLSVILVALTIMACKKDQMGTQSTANNPTQKTVIVYGAPWCSSCENLKSLLNDNNIAYEDPNTDESSVDSELEDKLVNAGIINAGESYSIPVVEVDGTILYGSEISLANIQAHL